MFYYCFIIIILHEFLWLIYWCCFWNPSASAFALGVKEIANPEDSGQVLFHPKHPFRLPDCQHFMFNIHFHTKNKNGKGTLSPFQLYKYAFWTPNLTKKCKKIAKKMQIFYKTLSYLCLHFAKIWGQYNFAKIRFLYSV